MLIGTPRPNTSIPADRSLRNSKWTLSLRSETVPRTPGRFCRIRKFYRNSRKPPCPRRYILRRSPRSGYRGRTVYRNSSGSRAPRTKSARHSRGRCSVSNTVHCRKAGHRLRPGSWIRQAGCYLACGNRSGHPSAQSRFQRPRPAVLPIAIKAITTTCAWQPPIRPARISPVAYWRRCSLDCRTLGIDGHDESVLNRCHDPMLLDND